MTSLAAPVLATDTARLRAGSHRLRAVALDLEGTSRRLGAGGAGPAWTGPAALAQARALSGYAAAAASGTAPAEEAAGLIDRLAREVDDLQDRARRAGAELTEAQESLVRLEALPLPTDPALRARVEQARAELQARLQSARAGLEEVRQEFDALTGRVSDQLQRIWQGWLERTADGALQRIPRAVTAVQVAAVQARLVSAAVLGRLTLSLAATGLARQQAAARTARALALLRAVQNPRSPLARELLALGKAAPPWIRVAARTPGPLGSALSWAEALRTSKDGNGYQGLRGDITRALGTVALVSGPAQVVGLAAGVPVIGPAAAVVGAVGTIGMTTYQVWMLGNALVDATPVMLSRLRDDARRAAEAARRRGTRVGVRLTSQTQRRLTQAHRFTVRTTLRVDRAIDRARSGAGRRIGRLLHDPPRLPDPRDLGRGLRSPVLPPLGAAA